MPLNERLVRRHHSTYLAVRSEAARRVGTAWNRVRGLDDRALDAWLDSVLPTVEGARAQTAALASGFLASAGFSATGGAVEIRRGASLREIYARPFVTARTALSRGLSFTEALELGRLRALGTIETDLSLTNREAMGKATDRRIRYWRRVLTGKSCMFCATASTQRYRKPDLLPLHPNCDCSVAPIAGSDPGRVINRQLLGQLKENGPDYWKQRGFVDPDGNPLDPTDLPRDAVAVHIHGELGPVLTDPRHDFTGPGDIAA